MKMDENALNAFDWRGQLVLRRINPFSSKWRKGGLRVFAAYSASAACTRSSYLLRNWSQLGKAASISILRWISERPSLDFGE
jgi:hypothetical protein